MFMSKNSSKPSAVVSVVMPVYNCEQFLPEALASLLIQTFEDFEIIAINDGSTDGSLRILERFAKLDNRLKIINQENSGIVTALNRGISEARGKYIARMDGDDISFPNRFKEQVSVLETEPNTMLVAGDFEVIDEASRTLYREVVVPDNEFISRAFYLRNAIAHGSVMFRKQAFEKAGPYSDKYGPTEDMELWLRMLKYGKFTATGTSIYRWRVNSSGITSVNNPESVKQANKHLARRWAESSPEYYTRKKLLKKVRSYLIDYGDEGVHYKRLFLKDSAQIAAKYFKQGRLARSASQLVVIASTGRQGLKIVVGRIATIIKSQLHR